MSFVRFLECGCVVGIFLVIWAFIIGEVVGFVYRYIGELRRERLGVEGLDMLTYDDLPQAALSRLNWFRDDGERPSDAWERLVRECECTDIAVCDDCDGRGIDGGEDALTCTTCQGDGVVAIADDGHLFNPFEGDV